MLIYANASKVIFVTFNLNCGFYAVSVGKPSARMSNFWTVQIRFGYFISETLSFSCRLLYRTYRSMVLLTLSIQYTIQYNALLKPQEDVVGLVEKMGF